jgi:hypothetical protein
MHVLTDSCVLEYGTNKLWQRAALSVSAVSDLGFLLPYGKSSALLSHENISFVPLACSCFQHRSFPPPQSGSSTGSGRLTYVSSVKCWVDYIGHSQDFFVNNLVIVYSLRLSRAIFFRSDELFGYLDVLSESVP